CGGGSGGCGPCRDESRSPGGSQHEPALPVPGFVREALAEGGQPISQAIRSRFETRLGRDLSEGGIHSSGRAAQSARAVDALAYTVGKDVAFAPGQYAPETNRGAELLAHELGHTVEQSRSGGPAATLRRQASTPSVPRLSIVAHASPLPATDCSAIGVDPF